MSTKVILSSKGQVVIPKYIRNKLGLHTGSELLINYTNSKVLELHHITRDIKEFFGKGKKRLDNKITDIDQTISTAVIENDRY